MEERKQEFKEKHDKNGGREKIKKYGVVGIEIKVIQDVIKMNKIFANRKRYEEMKPLLRQIEEETAKAKTAPDYKIMATEYARKCLDRGIQKYFEDHEMFTLKYFMDLFHY